MAAVIRFLYYTFIQSLWLSSILANPTHTLKLQERTPLQEVVTWDEYSIRVHGERVVLLSGEFHPFRLPSPGLWLDVFQKIRALGFSAVSFYLDWALLEGEPGHIRTDGVFSLDQFFNAANEAGIYLIARPGPYINSEVSGGGFPGWLARLKGRLKTTDPDYLDAITPYIRTIGNIISKAQVTKGGPVILLQPENEYTMCANNTGYVQANNFTTNSWDTSCLEKEYMAYVEQQYRKAGIVVPFINNDAAPDGNFAPGTGLGAVDIYSFDDYPLGWSTAPPEPSNWSSLTDPLSEYNFTQHEHISRKTPFSVSEFQGGVPDGWGGVGVDKSAAYINHEFERIFYKINYGFRAAIHSLYMIFGGTNWGNLGHPGGYTSYDVGAAIAENREVSREKYSELKLQGNFLQASPAYLTSHPENGTFGVYTNTHDLAVTKLRGSSTCFYIVHHRNLTSFASTDYTFQVPTSIGNLSIPQLGGSLSLNGRDSKFHVVDYDVGGITLIYSTAEVFTWKKSVSKTVLVLYGGENELHEFALPVGLGTPSEIEGHGIKVHKSKSAIVLQWEVKPSRRIVTFGDDLEVHLLWRNEAYNYWVLNVPAPGPLGLHASETSNNKAVIIKAGYLLRTAKISGNSLHLIGDVNTTTDIEVVSTPTNISSVLFNGEVATRINNGRLSGEITFKDPKFTLPDLQNSDWRYLDSLPEVNTSYDDSKWTICNVTKSSNPRNLSTPTSLYASDYGYNAGSLIYRGTFTANGSESSIYLLTEVGYAFGYSVWLNSTYLGSWPGSAAEMFHNETLSFQKKLHTGSTYVLTIVIDHMGNDENFPANVQTMKDPRGILDYNLQGREKSSISWKITGNLGGEKYHDLSRGPLNEGALYAERQGYHLPGAPTGQWVRGSPLQGIKEPGIRFFATSFDLHMPEGYDIPLSVVFTNTTSEHDPSTPARFRSELFINGWQFGKYINNIGPQVRYPIPEGILNYNGSNYLALSVWSQERGPVKLDGLKLQADAVIQSGYKKPGLVEGEQYALRSDSY